MAVLFSINYPMTSLLIINSNQSITMILRLITLAMDQLLLNSQLYQINVHAFDTLKGIIKISKDILLLYLWKLKGSCFKFRNHYRTHPLISFEAVECLLPKITDFVAIISIGYT